MEIENLNENVVNEEEVENTNSEEQSNKETESENKNFKNKRRLNKRQFNRRKTEVKEFEERVVNINRVTKVVKGGKRMKFSALVVIGDYKGRYGFGMRKSGEVPDAIKKSVDHSKHNLYKVNLVGASSIAHEVVGKFGGSKVFLKPAPEGTGIIAGGPVRAVLELCGVRNVYSKVYGSRTSINVIRATHDALSQLKNYRNVQKLRGLNSDGGNEDVK